MRTRDFPQRSFLKQAIASHNTGHGAEGSSANSVNATQAAAFGTGLQDGLYLLGGDLASVNNVSKVSVKLR